VDASLIRAVPELGPRGFEQVRKASPGVPTELRLDVRNTNLPVRTDCRTTIDGEVVNALLEVRPGHVVVRIGFNPASSNIEFSGLSFGFRCRDAQGVIVAEESWPKGDVVYVRSAFDQDWIHGSAIKGLVIDDRYSLEVWSVNAGETFSTSVEFTSPRPPRPFPSWTWGPGWTPPVPYPDPTGEAFYEWNEATLSWVLVP